MKYLAGVIIALSLCPVVLSITGSPAAAQDQSQSREKIYKPHEVTIRAKIVRKAQPRYTEEARRHRTSGIVIVRMVLRASGEVTDIVVVKGLPHGLNDSAVRAALETKFEPAIKDDQKVSQYLTLEYGFRIY